MQDNTNQYNANGKANGYWERHSGEFYYKAIYINDEVFGYCEHYFMTDNGITYEYHAR